MTSFIAGIIIAFLLLKIFQDDAEEKARIAREEREEGLLSE